MYIVHFTAGGLRVSSELLANAEERDAVLAKLAENHAADVQVDEVDENGNPV